MIQRPIKIEFRQETVHGILYLPNENNEYPLVIHLNGMPGFAPEKEKNRLAPILTNEGIAFFSFDYIGVRKSTGTFSYLLAQETIDAVITELVQQPNIIPNKIGLYAESFGGAMGICTACRDPRIRCLFLRSPVFDTNYVVNLDIFEELAHIWRRNNQMRIPKNGNLRELFKQESIQYNPMNLVDNLSIPVFVMGGSKDEILPDDGFKELYDKIPAESAKGYEIIQGADHNFTNKNHFEILKERIGEFYRGVLL